MKHNNGQYVTIPCVQDCSPCLVEEGQVVPSTPVTITRVDLEIQRICVCSFTRDFVENVNKGEVLHTLEQCLQSEKFLKLIKVNYVDIPHAVLAVRELTAYEDYSTLSYRVLFSLALGIPKDIQEQVICKGCGRRLRCELISECNLYNCIFKK